MAQLAATILFPMEVPGEGEVMFKLYPPIYNHIIELRSRIVELERELALCKSRREEKGDELQSV